MAYWIVKRAYSEYTNIEEFEGSYLDAVTRADELQFLKRDGEYLVRSINEPNWRGGSSYQSPMDWL